MKIGTRLGLAFGLVLAALAGVSILGLINSNLGLTAIASIENNAKSAVALANARNTTWALRWGVAQYIAVADADERAAIVAASAGLHKQFNDALNDYRSKVRNDFEKVMLKDLDASMDRYSSTRLKWFETYSAGRIEDAARLRAEELTPSGAETVQILGALIDIQHQASDSIEHHAMSAMTTARAMLAGLSLLALVLAALLAWWITHGLLRQLGGEPAYAVEVANRIAAGDLAQTVEVKGGDSASVLLAMRKMQSDIKDRIEAERKTVAENTRVEKRMAGLLNLAPDAVIAMDSDHRIIVFNTGAEKVFGYTAAEIIGRPIEDLMPVRFAGAHGKNVSAFAQDLAPAREMGSRRELRGRRKDGNEFPAEASISILREESGPVFFAILRDVSEKRQIAQKLEQLAMHDSLTGLPNRNLFMDRLSQALALAEREEKLAALLFIDLDGFKRVNDTLGHAAGDDLLCTVAQRLRRSVRRSDTVARLGGDEFAVILEKIQHVDSVGAIAQTIIDRVREPVQLAGNEVSVSASVGITICPFDSKSVRELMVDADRAMYEAKTSGKNCFKFHAAELTPAGARRDPSRGGYLSSSPSLSIVPDSASNVSVIRKPSMVRHRDSSLATHKP